MAAGDDYRSAARPAEPELGVLTWTWLLIAGRKVHYGYASERDVVG
jgi:hypothetical protein